jgi:cyclase
LESLALALLKRRLIPKLQLKRAVANSSYELVTTIGFGQCIKIGDPVSQAKIYQAQNVDELILVDLDSLGPTADLVALLKKTTENIFMPITVGGGVRSVENFRLLLQSGADKVAVNTYANKTPELLNEASAQFGAQCVVASIDFKKNMDGHYRVIVEGGRADTKRDLVDWAKECENRGAGELLLTSIDRDGFKSGLELEAVRLVAKNVNIPVIAGGGCGVSSHFVEGFMAGADAVAAGTFFCHQDQSPMQCRSHIKNAGIPIRLHL